MSELSGSSSRLLNGPESSYVVAAIDALLRHDRVGARVALLDGAEVAGWEAIAHRLDVAGRALAVDAGLRSEDDTDEIVLLPDLDTSSWVAGDDREAGAVLTRWSSPGSGDPLPAELVWSSLAVVAWLVDRAGYPAQVVV